MNTPKIEPGETRVIVTAVGSTMAGESGTVVEIDRRVTHSCRVQLDLDSDDIGTWFAPDELRVIS
jgi:hypothetical protein